MFKKKICLLGSYGVGKTSLVSRFVRSEFAEKYQTTVGVKVDKKVVQVGEREVWMILWDMAGEETDTPVKLKQVADARGYLLVVDGCRPKTLEVACSIQQRVESEIGSRPFLLLANKADERSNWNIPESAWEELTGRGWKILDTSAKTGQNVEEAFVHLAARMLKEQDDDALEEDD